MTEHVVVVVVTYNSADVVGDLLDTVPAAMGDLRYEVVVVDNSSSDDTVDLVRRRGDVRVIQQPNHGYSAGINAGVAAVPDATSILVLNPDVRLTPEAGVTMVRRLRSSGCGIVTPRIVGSDGHLALSLRREPTLLRASGLSFLGPRSSEYVREEDEYAAPHTVAWAVGAVMLVDRCCHDQLGGWDESYFLYSEETDLCLRARDAGWTTFYEPKAVATHIGGGSGRSGHTHTMQILNRVRLYSRRHGSVSSWVYFGLTVLSESSWILRGNEVSRASLKALLRPSVRPSQLGLSQKVLPR